MSDLMTFPKTVDEFMEEYKIVDTEEVYTNGDELVPIFRMKQWFEAHEAIPIEWIKKKLDKLKDDIKWAWYYGNVALEKMEWAETWVQVVLLEEWEKENEID